MIFKDRKEAAELLSEKLLKFKANNPLILGIPRGAMPMAEVIAQKLNAEMNAVLVHKIPHPHNEELAVGSVGLSGEVQALPNMDIYGITKPYLEKAGKIQLEKLKKRQKSFGISKPNCKDRVVIVVDDGIATGATVFGAIHEIKKHRPKKIILAAAVCARETADRLIPLVDEFIVLDIPEPFYAVSNFFYDFNEVTDDDVIEIFHRTKESPSQHASA